MSRFGELPEDYARPVPRVPLSLRATRQQQEANPDHRLVYLYIGTSSGQALGHNPRRRYLLVQNQGAGAIWVTFVSPATDDGFKIDAGGYWEPWVVPPNALYIIAAVDPTHVCIIEG